MDIRILGCFGGEMPGYRTTCLMVDGKILIDAGAITSALPIEEQQKIEAIVLTHSHLDHIRDLGFLADNIFGQRSRPVRIYGLAETIKSIRTHVLNNMVWPDFSQLPSPENPVISFHELDPGEAVDIEGVGFTPIKVNHTVPTAGLIVQNRDAAFVLSGDTGPTEQIWIEAAKIGNLKTVILETSFPDRMAQLAGASGHLTPATAKAEIEKIDHAAMDVRIFHIKPQYQREIINDLDPENTGLKPLEQDETISI